MKAEHDQFRHANWKQVNSLIALNAAIVISWIAYHNYQPKVLELFHFQQLSFFLIVAQSAILVLIPGAAGLIGDYVIRTSGNRFVIFTVGISIAAMVFMCVAFTVGTATTLNLTAALPAMIIVWLISMNIFHSPANSMLELFAPARELPSAMALMVMTTDLLYAFESLVANLVDALGPALTFGMGGVLLVITGYFFRRTTRNIKLNREYDQSRALQSSFGVVFIAAALLGLVSAVIKNDVAVWMAAKAGASALTSNPSLYVSFILVVAAVSAWPLSRKLGSIGLRQGLSIGLAGAFASLVLVWLIPGIYAGLLFSLVTGIFFSMASVFAFPYALKNLAVRNVTLGAGLFFGSFELSDALMNIISNWK